MPVMKHLLLTTIAAVVLVGTLLHRSVGNYGIPARKEIFELLIANGADLNPKIESAGIHKGKTPLDLAKQHRETTDSIGCSRKMQKL
jgi:hypothetical protein